MLSLAALVFAPAVYAQQPAQSSELAKFAPPMIPHPIAAYIPITPEKNVCVMCHIPGEPGMKVAKGSPTPLPPSHVSDGKVIPTATNACSATLKFCRKIKRRATQKAHFRISGRALFLYWQN